MTITTKDVRVNGYPPLDIILAHFDALPVLLETLRRFDPTPEAMADWEAAKNILRPPVLLHAVSRRAEEILNPVEV